MNSTDELRTLKEEQLQLMLEKQRRLALNSFYNFVRLAWPSVWGDTVFRDNWHFQYLCNKIQRAAERVIHNEKREKDLVINVPPGTSKSTIISICLNAWVWAKDPTRRFLTTSYSPELAGDHAKATRKLITSLWYQSLFGHMFVLVGSAETFYETDKGGRRMITSPGSAVGTGFHADYLIFDDPDSAAKVYSPAQRSETMRWFDEVMPSRLADPEIGLKIVVQQRLHQQDTTGHVREKYPDKWDFTILPALKSRDVFPLELAKRYKNDLLFPARLSMDVIDDYRKRLRNGFAGQMMMTPLTEGGNFFRESWPHWFTREQMPVFDQIILSVDASFKDSETSCPASVQVWGLKTPNFYMIHDMTTRMGAIETGNAIERLALVYPAGTIIVIEPAANGYYLIERLRKKFPIYAFPVSRFGGKEVRAEIVAALWETGNVYILDTPYNRNHYWPEILAFPSNQWKDRVDAMSQAILYYTKCRPMGAQWVTPH
jgi:predicted phage terminase large subunit-like protein